MKYEFDMEKGKPSFSGLEIVSEYMGSNTTMLSKYVYLLNRCGATTASC